MTALWANFILEVLGYDETDKVNQYTGLNITTPTKWTPEREGYIFAGAYANQDGSGTQYYDANGNWQLGEIHGQIIRMYVKWIDQRSTRLYWSDNSEDYTDVAVG